MTLSAIPVKAREHYFDCKIAPWECRVCREVERYIDYSDEYGIAEGEEG